MMNDEAKAMCSTRTIKRKDAMLIGWLGEDSAKIAAKIVKILTDSPRLVWVEEDGRLYSRNVKHAMDLPASSIVGTYALGHLADAIEEDLGAAAQERTKKSSIG